MTEEEASADLAERLAGALLAVEGVQELFPARHGAGVLAAVEGRRREPRDLVRVQTLGTGLRVVVRLGTSRTVPSSVVAERVLTAVRDVLGPGIAADVEIAYIE